jgi:hypothetical protein
VIRGGGLTRVGGLYSVSSIDGGEDAPLSRRGRIEFRILLVVLILVGCIAVGLVAVSR